MRRTVSALLTSLTLLGGASVAAQHQGHQMAGQTAAPGSQPDAQIVNTCVQSQQQAIGGLEVASRRLEMARQTNDPPAMRSAMDDLLLVLSRIQSQLAPCAQLAASTPGQDPQAGHGAMPATQQSPAQQTGTPLMQPGSTTPAAGAASQGAPSPAAGAPSKPGAMDHAAMGHGAAGAKPPAAGAKPEAGSATMDHSKMGRAPAGEKPAAPAAKPAPAASADHSKMGRAAPDTKPPGQDAKPAEPGAKPTEPMDHSKMAMGKGAPKAAGATLPVTAAEEVMDPACPNVNTKTAPKATYQRKVYYFCSTKDRDEFVKDPAAFLKKRPRG